MYDPNTELMLKYARELTYAELAKEAVAVRALKGVADMPAQLSKQTVNKATALAKSTPELQQKVRRAAIAQPKATPVPAAPAAPKTPFFNKETGMTVGGAPVNYGHVAAGAGVGAVGLGAGYMLGSGGNKQQVVVQKSAAQVLYEQRLAQFDGF
jgi:hypothetical protein